MTARNNQISLNSQPSTLDRGTLNLEVKRHCKTRWGVDGKLYIDGKYAADTTEHPTSHFATGKYQLSLKHLLFCRGNGPMLNTDGRICVGEYLCAGCVLKTREVFMTVYNRIQKALKRGQKVTLTIKDAMVMVIVMVMVAMTSCSAARQVQGVEHATHDTLYINTIQFDSIYVDNFHQIDRSRDTVTIREILRENHYKLLRDTVRIAKTDTIPVIHEVEKPVKYIPAIYKWSLGICVVLVVIILAMIAIRVINVFRVP